MSVDTEWVGAIRRILRLNSSSCIYNSTINYPVNLKIRTPVAINTTISQVLMKRNYSMLLLNAKSVFTIYYAYGSLAPYPAKALTIHILSSTGGGVSRNCKTRQWHFYEIC